LIVLGDSITQGYLANVPYVNYISANNLTLIKNYGISQSTISNGTNASDPMCVRYSDMTNDADYVFVMGGTNDFIHSVEIGTNESTDVSTFKGALNVLIEGLINKYPSSKIAFSTPIPTKYNNVQLESNLKKYVAAIIEICQKWSIPCLNLFACSRINPNNATILNNYFKNDTTQGIHPDENGQRVISEVIESFLNNLYVTDYLTGTKEETPETDNNLLKTAKIALAHLNEYPNYYNKHYGLPAFEENLKKRYINN
jgi:lysophospholipase L1-like esterase